MVPHCFKNNIKIFHLHLQGSLSPGSDHLLDWQLRPFFFQLTSAIERLSDLRAFECAPLTQCFCNSY